MVHYLFLPEFKKAYPAAKLIGVEEALQRLGDKALKFDGSEFLVRSMLLPNTNMEHDSLGKRSA
jgi:hypothetical protein